MRDDHPQIRESFQHGAGEPSAADVLGRLFITAEAGTDSRMEHQDAVVFEELLIDGKHPLVVRPDPGDMAVEFEASETVVSKTSIQKPGDVLFLRMNRPERNDLGAPFAKLMGPGVEGLAHSRFVGVVEEDEVFYSLRPEMLDDIIGINFIANRPRVIFKPVPDGLEETVGE